MFQLDYPFLFLSLSLSVFFFPDYAVYSKPFSVGSGSSAPYRPTKSADADIYGGAGGGGDEMGSLLDTGKFKADKGFAGTDAAPRGGVLFGVNWK